MPAGRSEAGLAETRVEWRNKSEIVRARGRSEAPLRVLARTVTRLGRLLLLALPTSVRTVTLWRLVNLLARGMWELGLRWAPRGTTYRRRLASGARVELDLSERIQGQAAITGAYEATLAAEIAAQLPPGGTFFDVGANVGLVTIEVLGRAQSPRVHAFEPHPDNVAALRRNLLLNPPGRVEVVEAAVGEAPGSATLLVSANPNESGWHRIGSGTEAETPTDGAIDVSVTALDAYAKANGIDHVDVLKIDAEGSELGVLEGARDLLSRQAIELVILEISEPLIEKLGGEARQLYDVMQSYGYRGEVIPSTSPTRVIPGTRHLAADDVAFRPRRERGSSAH